MRVGMSSLLAWKEKGRGKGEELGLLLLLPQAVGWRGM